MHRHYQFDWKKEKDKKERKEIYVDVRNSYHVYTLYTLCNYIIWYRTAFIFKFSP